MVRFLNRFQKAFADKLREWHDLRDRVEVKNDNASFKSELLAAQGALNGMKLVVRFQRKSHLIPHIKDLLDDIKELKKMSFEDVPDEVYQGVVYRINALSAQVVV